MSYMEFLKRKMDIAPETGFDIDISEINPALKPHQKLQLFGPLKAVDEQYSKPLDLVRQ
ncbi:hypothetical protein [Ruminiclostridium josui]|uniref:hypothetical protein n=1 Tax=Ruminiclostridium josui TaxID=1499 RepID=UPI000AC4D3B8|nr:hypothetical protein [Ruminiclostridium josui]